MRLAVLRALSAGPLTVGDLLSRIPVEQNLMSHHLRVLREGGLVISKRAARSVSYALAPGVSADEARSIDLGCCRLTFPAGDANLTGQNSK